MSKLNFRFASLFKKYRLRSEFETLTAFGDALAEEGAIYEDSLFSHWQKGFRTPSDRRILLKILKVFIKHRGLNSIGKANEFMESANQGYLTNTEVKDLFNITIQNRISSLDEFILEENDYITKLSGIWSINEILYYIEEEVDLCFDNIHEGYLAFAYNKLCKLADIIYKHQLHRTKKGIQLIDNINWMRVRALVDLTKTNGFKYTVSESERVYLMAKESHSPEFGPSCWQKSGLIRIEILNRKNIQFTKEEVADCIKLDELAIKNTSDKRPIIKLLEYVDLAKMALLPKDRELFQRAIDASFFWADKLPEEQQYLTARIWDAKARGSLRFSNDIKTALHYVQRGKRYYEKRYQSISLFSEITELHILRSSKDPYHQTYADKLQTKLELKLSVLGDHYYQASRLKSKKFIGL